MPASHKNLIIGDDDYFGEVARGFLITLGEGVTPHQLNLCVLKRFFKKLPHNDCIKYVKRRQDNNIFVAVHPGAYADALYEVLDVTKDIDGFPVDIDVPPEYRFTMRIITHPELQYLDTTELKELLSDVPDLKYIQIKANSTSAILGFNLEEHLTPSTVVLGWDTVNLRPLKPIPTRCYKCQTYGHQAGTCRAETRCSRCSLPGHDHSTCSATSPKCAACGGEHDVFDKKCPEWIKRKKTYAAATKTEKKQDDVITTATSQEAIQTTNTRQPKETSTSTTCKPNETTKRTTQDDTRTTLKPKKPKKQLTETTKTNT